MNARSATIHIRRNTVNSHWRYDGEEEVPAKIKMFSAFNLHILVIITIVFKVIVIMANTFIIYEYFQSHMVS